MSTHRQSLAARVLGRICTPRKAASSRQNGRLGGLTGGRPPRTPYTTRVYGAPYSTDGEVGADVRTLRHADMMAKHTLQAGQTLRIYRGPSNIATWTCDAQGHVDRVTTTG